MNVAQSILFQLHDNLVGNITLQLLVGQADTILHADLVTHSAFLAEDRNALDLDPVLDDAGRVAADWSGRAFDASPRSNAAVPANNGVENAGIMLDFCILQDDGVFDSGTCADDCFRSNRDVGPQLGGRVHGGRGMDKNRRDNVGRGACDFFRLRLESLLQVQGVGRNGRPSSLDLTPEVLGLVHEEAVAVRKIRQDVLFQTKDFVLLSIIIQVGHKRGLQVLGRGVRNHTWSLGLAFDGASNGGEDAFGGEEVNTAIDQVGNMALGLLHVMKNPFRVGVRNNATEVGGGIIGDAGTQDDGLGILLLEQLEHRLEGKRTADIRVEHKEPIRFALQDGISEVIEAPRRAQSLVLSQILDLDLRELSRRVFDEVTENGFVIVADQNDFLDIGDFGDGFQTVPDDGVAGNIEERLKGASSTGQSPVWANTGLPWGGRDSMA